LYPSESGEVRRVVDTTDPRFPLIEVDLAEAAGVQYDTPVSRKRLIQQLGQERAIDAVVTDENNRLITMLL
jgi:hypothetical protein